MNKTDIKTAEVRLWNASIYARLSREDGDKIESDSITNQRDLVKEYLKDRPEIKICSERVDDGYSGVTFDRPALKAMLDDIKIGIINCIVVKDLSRFGRNYIEAGRYIRTLFPLLGVRFIAINDGYDSADETNPANEYIIPFKNIINDAYCADISKKVRSQLEIKRKKGDFIGSFAVFGYLKSKENKNKLVVDEIAAEVVKDIFKWKLSGMSCQSIAEKLNNLGVLSPFEYKKSIGLNFKTSFKINIKAKWSPIAIKRILADETYTGAVIQGKTTTPNYKIKQKVIKEKSEWEKVENVHEAIIPREEFMLIADLLGRDTYKTNIHPFSSMLFCSKCGYSLIRKVTTMRGRKYICHACLKNHKNGKRAGCSGIRVKESVLFTAVTTALKHHINTVLNIDEILHCINEILQNKSVMQKLHNQIEARKADCNKLENRKAQLYGDFKDEAITRDEYISFKKNYDYQILELQATIKNLQNEINRLSDEKSQETKKWIEYITERSSVREYDNFTEPTRELIVKFIDKIIVYEGGTLEIIFRYKDEFILSEAQARDANLLSTLYELNDANKLNKIQYNNGEVCNQWQEQADTTR
ncbi:MAG: recombinase family protein [Oscillospiraceae bacterium]|nr:recombinase family protein [Oscillospiraceae bacterium]